jgi:exopolysaccharide biosynthesis WecB/TagA/CpsF family protein
VIPALRELPVRSILGFPIHAVTMDRAVEVCREAIVAREPLVTGVINVAKIINMRKDQALKQAVMASDLIVADGAGVVWASCLLGERLPERIPGIDLFENLLALADREGFSVFLLGATPQVLEGVQRQIASRFPRARVAGARDGYFPDSDAESLAQGIRAARPDILFVGMTSPKKEVFLGRWGEIMNVPVCHGVGGSFDVMAGKVKRAPRLWQRMGLEWLYRVLQEPRRLWKRYLVTNSVFLGLLVRELVRRHILRRRPQIP